MEIIQPSSILSPRIQRNILKLVRENFDDPTKLSEKIHDYLRHEKLDHQVGIELSLMPGVGIFINYFYWN